MTASTMSSTPPAAPPQSPQPAGKGFIVLGFIVSSLFTAGLGYLGQRHFLDYQNQQTDLIAKVAAFEKQSGDLPSLVADLNIALKNHKNTERQRAALAANTREQYRTLTDALPYIPGSQMKSAQQYLTTLANMSEEAPKADEILKVGPFLQEFEYSILERENVVTALRRTAGLPVVVLRPSVSNDLQDADNTSS